MENLPLVSIIIPVYNVEAYIERCLLSVLNQTYSHIEIIIIDDCTPDNSITIAKELISAYTDKNVHIIKHEGNRGLSAARNTGIRNSTGEYIYFLDSDDEIVINAIEKLVSFIIKESNIDIVVGGVEVIGNYPEVIIPFADGETLLSNENILNSFFKNELYVMAWNKLVKRSFILDNNLFFYEGIYHEDLLWSFEVAKKAKKITFCLDKTYLYYIRGNSIVGSIKPKNIEDLLFIYEKIVLDAKRQNLIWQNPHFINFIESTRFHILFISDSKIRWTESRNKMLSLSPVSVKSMFLSGRSFGSRIKIFLLLLPKHVSYLLFKCRKKLKI